MFRVSFFVDDKALAEVMHAISNRARELVVVPVSNAAFNGKAVQAIARSNVELIMKELKARKVETFTPELLRTAVKKVGLNPNSTGYFVKQLKDARMITAAGNGNKVLYTVVQS